jgi:hypothetical protein
MVPYKIRPALTKSGYEDTFKIFLSYDAGTVTLWLVGASLFPAHPSD